MDKLNILIMASSRGGGLSYQLTELSISIKLRGHNVSIISNSQEQIPGLKKRLEDENISVKICNHLENNSPYSICKSIETISLLLKKERFDVIHANGFSHLNKAFLASQLANKRNLILCCTLHSSEVYSSQIKKKMVSFCGNMADIINPLCNSAKLELLNSGIPYEKLVIIPNGINLSKFDQLKFEKNIPKIANQLDGKLIAYIAALTPIKGHYYYLKAAKLIISKHPDTLFLVIGDGPLKKDLMDQVSRLKIEKNVIFTGNVKNDLIPSIISKIDIGASSSLGELFPYSILELMAACKPVVATSVGGIPDIFEDRAGFLVAPGDYPALAAKVEFLINNPEFSTNMGVYGRKRIQEHFDLPLISKKLEDVYYKSLDKKLIHS